METGGEPDPAAAGNRSLRGDVSWSLILRGSALFARALVALAIARAVGIEDAGRYFVVVAIVGLAALAGRVGGDRLVLSEAVRDRAVTRHAFGVLARRAVLVSVLASGLTLAIAALADSVDRALLFGALAVVPLNIALIASSAVRGLGHLIVAITVGELLAPLAQIAIFFSLASRSAEDALLAYAIANLISGAVGLLAVHRLSEPGDGEATIRWRDAGALLVTAVNGQIRQSFPALAAGAVGGLAAAGGMGAAFRIDRVVLFPVEASRFAVAPSLKSTGPLDERVRRLAVTSARLAAAMQIPLLVAVLITPTTFLSVLGDDFEQASNWLRLMVAGSMINSLTGPTFQVLLVSDERNLLARTSIVASAVLLGSFAVFTPAFSTDAVAVAVAVAYVAAAGIEWWTIRTRLGGRVDVFAGRP